MPELTTSTAFAAATAPAVKAALSEFGKTIAQGTGKLTRAAVDRAIVALQIGFEEYLNTSYNKCRYFKTILNPQQPQLVLDRYVNVTLTCGRESVRDDDLLNSIQSRQRIVVTGLAGSGKSMLMKYITVRSFEYAPGYVPLFVELRHINALTEPNLLTFIRSSCTSKLASITETQFDLSLHSGALMLILDGFDELNVELRENIERQILDIQKDFPKAMVVVSSRPDERFNSWSSYFVYKVDKLSKSQVEKLIQSLDYDNGVRRRFLREVKSSLYESHESFLSSPLLASIMLLTYEEFAEIPQKMHAFYGQAFDTLLQKHDAQKEQYQRKTYTGLSREDFRRLFAAFCAMTYLEQRYSFTDDQLLEAANNATKYIRQTTPDFDSKVTGKKFIQDLFESVCMIQRDGTEISFVHRSFQEYFAALFAIGLHGDKLFRCIDKYAQRLSDSVLPMAMDMSRSVVENEWVLPTLDYLENIFFEGDALRSPALIFSLFFSHISMSHSGTRISTGAYGMNIDLLGRMESMGRLYPAELGYGLIIFNGFNKFDQETLETIVDEKNSGKFRYDELLQLLDADTVNAAHSSGPHVRRTPLEIALDPRDDWWLEEVGLAEEFLSLREKFENIRRGVRGRERKRSNLLDDLL